MYNIKLYISLYSSVHRGGRLEIYFSIQLIDEIRTFAPINVSYLFKLIIYILFLGIFGVRTRFFYVFCIRHKIRKKDLYLQYTRSRKEAYNSISRN